MTKTIEPLTPEEVQLIEEFIMSYAKGNRKNLRALVVTLEGIEFWESESLEPDAREIN